MTIFEFCEARPMGEVEESKELGRRFLDAYGRRMELYRRRFELEGLIHDRLVEQRTLRKAIETNKTSEDENRPRQQDQATMFGTGIHRLSVVNIGELPKENPEMFHTETAIFPIGYMCRKKYKKHNMYGKKTKDRILYICTVDPQKGPVITADDGREWSGPNVWADFVDSFEDGSEYKALAEFFGFGNPVLGKKIEGLGDTSIFRKYIPWANRTKAPPHTESMQY